MKKVSLAALLSLSLTSGCSDQAGPTGPAGSTFPQRFQGTVSTSSPLCSDYFDETRLPCESFQIVPPTSGVLDVRLTWSDPATRLSVGLSATAATRWSACPTSGCSTRLGVVGGTTYTLSVGLLGGPSSSQAFVLDVAHED